MRHYKIFFIDNRQYYLFGDSAFIMRPWCQVAFNRTIATPEQKVFNTKMSRARVCVEWSYKDVKQQFTKTDFARSFMLRKAPVALEYKMSVLLWNLKVCFHGGGQTGMFFKHSPPTIEQYLSTIND